MSRGKRTDVALYEGIGNLPGVAGTGWQPGVGMPGMGAGATSGAAPSQSIFQLIDDRMRGRWMYAIILGAILAAVAATVGYMSAEPMFVSAGTIEIQREVRFIYHKLEDLTGTSDYDRFVATQVQYIGSSTVIGEAVQDEKVKALKISRGMLKDGLSVERDRQSQLVYVSFEAEDPRVAEASVNAILDAYFKVYGQNAKAEIDSTLNELDLKIKKYERDYASLDNQIRAITTKHNATDLAAVQKANFEEMAWLKMQIREGRHALARLESTPAGGAGAGAGAQQTVQVPSAKGLAMIEPALPDLEAQVRQAQGNFDMVKDQWRPETNQYQRAQRTLQLAKDAYDRAYQHAIEQWRKLGPDALQQEGMSETITAGDITMYETRLAEVEQNQKALVTDIASLASLTAEQGRVQADMLGMRNRMNSIEMEIKPLNKVIQISQHGSLPDEPAKDQRKTRLLMGLAAGFAASFGAFFLLGTIDRRAFGASQLGLGGNLPPCLGVLPDLGKSLSDPETSDVASHCVHQIRNQIEAVRDPSPGYVLCVSSPFQGDGKTSIVMALGWSYAAAGYNTLVIDCDMIGRSLTRQLGLTGREGLREALLTKELNGSVNRLPWANLSAVPVGVDARFGPENIRRMDLERLVDQVRQQGQYDMIIIDTGPLLGSLESTPVTSVADGVIFSVRRGRSRAKLEECVNRLKIVGTPCIGVILNCAQRADCNRYVSEASLAAADDERGTRPALPAHAPGERNALVRAVQATTRQRDGGDEPPANASSEQDR